MSNEFKTHYQDNLLETPAPCYSNEDVRDIAKKHFGLTGKLFPLDSERDQNFRLKTKTGDQFVIKIANSAENRAIVDMQIKALEHIAVTNPGMPVPEVVISRNGMAIEQVQARNGTQQVQARNGTQHHVRILTYLPGAPPKDNPVEPVLLRPMGACLAKLALSLRGFFHPTANYELLWDLKHTSKLRQFLPYISDTKLFTMT